MENQNEEMKQVRFENGVYIPYYNKKLGVVVSPAVSQWSCDVQGFIWSWRLGLIIFCMSNILLFSLCYLFFNYIFNYNSEYFLTVFSILAIIEGVIIYFSLKITPLFNNRWKIDILSPFIIRFKECPYSDCKKDVSIYYDWTCPKCKRKQGKERQITLKCVHCGEKLTHFVCEHCKRIFVL